MPLRNAQTPPALHQPPPHSLRSDDDAMADSMEDSDTAPERANKGMSLPLGSDDTETDDDIATPARVPVRIFTPPPHIAARFYRPSAAAQASAAARRKSASAASSRRNSISSTHSRSSHGYDSVTAAAQSKHVAQHLRRASILADRKARLADRAAHVEQVRLRAAMARAAVRDTTLSEERAHAAAQAREKNLAEIAATCAEEVKRAKAVAESIKEKREQDLQRLRQQIQDRLDEAERRREEQQLRRNSNVGRSSRARGHSLLASSQPAAGSPLRKGGSEISEASEGEADADADADARLVPEETRLTQEEAAFRILSWWRTAHRRKAVAEFQLLGLAVDDVRKTSFETVVELLGQDRVLLATGKVLRLCGVQEGKTSSVKEIVAVRAFLSAFLILGHPTQVLNNKDGDVSNSASPAEAKTGGAGKMSSSSNNSNSNNKNSITVKANGKGKKVANTSRQTAQGQQEQELVAKARDLLICFETILSRLTPANQFTPPPSLSSELVEAYDTFYEAFIAWKARDASALVDVMIKQFVELDAIWQTVKDSTDPSVTDTYRQSIQQNQLLLMVRIKKLAGPEEGKRKVFDAVRKARRAKAEASKKAAAASSDLKPREIDHTIETAMGDLTGGGGSAGPTNSGGSLTTATAAGQPGRTADESLPFGRSFAEVRAEKGAGLPAIAHQQRHQQHQHQHQHQHQQRYSSHPLPENRVVVHELALNRNYRVSATEFRNQQAQWMAPVFRRMRKTMDTSNHEEQEEHFFYLLSIAETMRMKLQRMTIPGKKMHQFVGELLDTDVARRQFAIGSFSYERFFASMGQLLPQLCAPIRDEEVRELVDHTLATGDYVDRLEALHGFIDIMLTDHVNFLISVAAPELLQSATKYEATRFAEMTQRDPESGRPVLPAAAAAWRAARARVLAEAAKRDPEGHHHPRSRPTPTQFYTHMLVDVFTQLGPVAPANMPEMLQLDHVRALRWGAVTRRIVTAGAVLLQCKNLLKRDVRVPWKTEAQRVMAVLEAADQAAEKQAGREGQSQEDDSHPLPVDGVLAALESGRSMPAATRAQLRACVQRTLAASEAAKMASASSASSAPSEPVFRLLLHRLRGHLVARLAAATTMTEKARQSSSAAGERLTSLGLAEFVDRVREMMDEIGRIGIIDREMHGVFWEEVAAQVEAEDEGGEKKKGEEEESSG